MHFFFCPLKGVLLYIWPIRVVLQPSLKSWMNECVCVWVCARMCVIIIGNATGFIFSMLLSLSRIDVSFYCDDLTLPNCSFLLIFSFFFLFEFFLCVAFVFLFFSRSTSTSWFRFVWLLTMSWLNTSKSYTNWTIKDILNSDTLLFLLFFIMNSSNRRAHKWETQNSCLSSDTASCWALSGVKQRI